MVLPRAPAAGDRHFPVCRHFPDQEIEYFWKTVVDFPIIAYFPYPENRRKLEIADSEQIPANPSGQSGDARPQQGRTVRACCAGSA